MSSYPLRQGEKDLSFPLYDKLEYVYIISHPYICSSFLCVYLSTDISYVFFLCHKINNIIQIIYWKKYLQEEETLHASPVLTNHNIKYRSSNVYSSQFPLSVYT